MSLFLPVLMAGGFSAYIIYKELIVPNVTRRVKDDFSKMQLSKNREIANIQQFLQTIKDRVTQLNETVELIDSDTLRQATVAEVGEIGDLIDSINKGLEQSKATLSQRARSGGRLGKAIGFFTNGGNKQSIVIQSAEAAGFYGANNVNTFLTVVAQKFPDINNRDKFINLSEERREAVIRKVKSNNLPGNQ
jgi:methyl-accepting chemotaxis protein